MASSVNPFVEIPGVSGALYRFRLIGDPSQMPAEAGNFLVLRETPEGAELLCCGTAVSLARASGIWDSAVEKPQTDAVFVRLNVSRNVRDAEHLDIIHRCEPRVVLTELD